MDVTITDHNARPVTVANAVNGRADVPNPAQLERAVVDAAKYTRITGTPTSVDWNASRGWWQWDPSKAA